MECQHKFRQLFLGSEVGGAKNERYMYMHAYIMQLEQILNRYDWNIILNIEFDIFKKKMYIVMG